MKQPKLLMSPWANKGLKNDIPDARSQNIALEAATYSEGFPQITMTPIAMGGKAPSGKDMNGILHDLSAHTVFQNQGGIYQFDADFAKKIGGYPKGVVLINNALTQCFMSLIDKNTTNFNTTDFKGKWQVVSGVDFFVPKTQVATLVQQGITKLNSAVNSTSETEAATPKAVKTVKDQLDSVQRNQGNYILTSKKSNAVNSNSADTVASSVAVKTAFDRAVSAEANNRFQKIYVGNNALTLDLTQKQQIIDLFGNSYRDSGYLTFSAHNNKESNIQGLPRADKAPIVMTFYLMGGYSIFYCHYPTLNRQYFTGVNFNNPTLTLNWIEVLNSKGTHTTEQLRLTANSWGKLFFPNAKGGEWRIEFNPESETDPRFNLVYTKADKSTRYLSFPVLNKGETAAYRSWVDEQIKANFTRSKVVNEDLNNVKAYGVYAQEANNQATTERHYPVNYAGSLLVLPSAYGVMQQYIPFNTGAIYQRNLNTDLKTWSAWRRVDGIDKIDKSAISHATNGTSTTKVASELAVKNALDQTVKLTGDQKEINGYKSFNGTLESKYRFVVRRDQEIYSPYMNLIDQSVDMEADKVKPKNIGEILWRAGKANNGDGVARSLVKTVIEADKNITLELGGWDAAQAYKCFLKGWTKDNNVVVGKTTNDGKNRLQVAGTISATTPPVNGSNDQVVTIGWAKELSKGYAVKKALSTEDLNNVTQAGIYGQSANVNATSARHYPEQKAGMLLVTDTSGFGAQQLYMPYDNGYMYMRGRNNKDWNAWKRVDGVDKIDKTAISHATNGKSNSKVVSELALAATQASANAAQASADRAATLANNAQGSADNANNNANNRVAKWGDTMTGTLTLPKMHLTENGTGESLKVGDDAWMGDVNLGDTVGLKGQGNQSAGWIAYGTGKKRLGFDGTEFRADAAFVAPSVRLERENAWLVVKSNTTNNASTDYHIWGSNFPQCSVRGIDAGGFSGEIQFHTTPSGTHYNSDRRQHVMTINPEGHIWAKPYGWFNDYFHHNQKSYVNVTGNATHGGFNIHKPDGKDMRFERENNAFKLWAQELYEIYFPQRSGTVALRDELNTNRSWHSRTVNLSGRNITVDGYLFVYPSGKIEQTFIYHGLSMDWLEFEAGQRSGNRGRFLKNQLWTAMPNDVVWAETQVIKGGGDHITYEAEAAEWVGAYSKHTSAKDRVDMHYSRFRGSQGEVVDIMIKVEGY